MSLCFWMGFLWDDCTFVNILFAAVYLLAFWFSFWMTCMPLPSCISLLMLWRVDRPIICWWSLMFIRCYQHMLNGTVMGILKWAWVITYTCQWRTYRCFSKASDDEECLKVWARKTLLGGYYVMFDKSSAVTSVEPNVSAPVRSTRTQDTFLL